MQEIISTREAAQRLEVSPRTITRGIHAGVFRAKYGGLYKNRIVGVYVDSIEELERRATPPPDGDGYATRDIRPAAR